MRILYITDIDFSSKDAPPIHVKEIINNLSCLKNNLFLICLNNRDNLKIRSKIRNVFVIKNKIIRDILFNIKLFFIIPGYIKKNKIDLIYTRQGLSLIAPAALSKLLSTPYITEINGNIEDELLSYGLPKFYIKISKLVERYCYKKATKIISVTQKIKESIIKKYKIPAKKIIVLENGVDSNKFKPLWRYQNNKEKIIGYIGNFASWQGVEYLIEAISIIKKNIPDVKCMIVGDGPERNELEDLSIKFGLKENIIFKGHINHTSIPKYINSFYLCVAPKKKVLKNGGGSPFKIYEYASCGKPTISTKIPGTEFISKNDCGIIVEPNNSRALAEAIAKLLNNPKLAENMGRNGRKAILNGHSWRNVAERTQKVIEDAIKENKK